MSIFEFFTVYTYIQSRFYRSPEVILGKLNIYIYIFFFRKNVVSLVSLNSNYLFIKSFWPSWLLGVWFHGAHRNAHRRGVFMSTDCNIKINL